MLGCCMLPLELVAGTFGATHTLGLQVEDVDLEEIAGCQFKFYHCCTWLSFKVHPSVFSGNSYSNTLDMAYRHYRYNDIHWQVI